jgi:hypothetical protein
MTRSRLLTIYVLFCGVFVVGALPAPAQAQVLNLEYEIKAGYFAYFGNLIKWPDQPFDGADKAFVIGVLGDNPFEKHLQANANGFAINAGRVKANNIKGKKIAVVEYKSVDEFETEFSPCHILFICRSSAAGVESETLKDRVEAALKKTKGQPVLLVAEATTMNASKTLAQSGVMISYWNDAQANQVRMFINRTAEKRERLNISARLLGLRLVTVL